LLVAVSLLNIDILKTRIHNRWIERNRSRRNLVQFLAEELPVVFILPHGH